MSTSSNTCRIALAGPEDAAAVAALYRLAASSPGSAWCEEYPTAREAENDAARGPSTACGGRMAACGGRRQPGTPMRMPETSPAGTPLPKTPASSAAWASAPTSRERGWQSGW